MRLADASSTPAGGLLAGLVVLPLYAATLIRKLSAARQRAEEASQAKSPFLTSVSHELRTPLNAIIGMSELLRETKLDPDQNNMTRTIGNAGRSLLSLINCILDFARIEERHIAAPTPRIQPSSPCSRMSERFLAPRRSEIRYASWSTSRPGRRADLGGRGHLEAILLNLVGNAVKFTEAATW